MSDSKSDDSWRHNREIMAVSQPLQNDRRKKDKVIFCYIKLVIN